MRPGFLQALLLCCALLGVPGPPACAEGTGQHTSDVPHRQAVDLSSGWRFRFAPTDVAGIEAPGFDDSEWQTVSVPHTWNRIGEYAQTRSGDTDNRQGTGWYRLSFAAPAAQSGMRQFLDFAAVGKIADVWVNGVWIGHHKGGFSRFRFDVTQAWKPGATNLIVVRADNSKVTPASATGQVIPLAGDFFVSGGIYRSVTLLTLPQVSIDPLDMAGPGIYADTRIVTPEKATIAVRTRLRNAGKSARKLTLTTTIRDSEGSAVVQRVSRVRSPSGRSEFEAVLDVAAPRLWDGRKDPYLYRVDASLSDGPRILDSVSQPLGIRTFRVDPDNGFFLNGRHVALHGVSRHQDRQGKGWALSAQDHADDMALIKELGANTVRQAHYQHADEWSDEADRAGMVVWAELPYVGAPSLTGGKGTTELWANAEDQLRELIRQNYNHPSIMMWSIGNEVDSAKAFGAMAADPSPVELLRHLNAVAKEEDKTRPTVIADFSEQMGAFGERRQALTEVPDLMGYNRYPGWYFFQGAMAGRVLGGMMDKLHAANPDKPISLSEYGAGGAASQHSDDPSAGYVSFAGRPQPEEYQSWAMELLWPAIADRRFLFASWLWNMFDFPSDLRNEGDSVDLNTKGLVTFDRKTRKDAFYYFQSAWNDTPVLHLTGKRYADRSYPVMDVKAYTNLGKARLTMNGHDMGEVACPNFTCEWKAVRLRPGANQAEASSPASTGQMRDTATWNGPDPFHNGVRIDAGNLAASVIDNRRYGSDSFVSGGKPIPRDSGSIGGRREAAPLEIRSRDPGLFDFWREGDSFTYAIPVPDGRWTVNIRTFEPSLEAPPTKRMTVTANGKVAIAPFNVATAAGGSLRELDRSFPVTVSGGMLRIGFAGSGGNAVVAAIEVSR